MQHITYTTRITAQAGAQLSRFVGRAQLSVILASARSEEGPFFADLLSGWADLIERMPRTYETDGQGRDALVHLHYFRGGSDWYIIERDSEAEQLQAYGLADLYGDGGELGYINVAELVELGAELDLYWTPRTLADVMAERGAA